MTGTLTFSIFSTSRTFEELKEQFDLPNTSVEFAGMDEDQVYVHIHVKIYYSSVQDAKIKVETIFEGTGVDGEVFSFKDENGNTLFTEDDENISNYN